MDNIIVIDEKTIDQYVSYEVSVIKYSSGDYLNILFPLVYNNDTNTFQQNWWFYTENPGKRDSYRNQYFGYNMAKRVDSIPSSEYSKDFMEQDRPIVDKSPFQWEYIPFSVDFENLQTTKGLLSNTSIIDILSNDTKEYTPNDCSEYDLYENIKLNNGKDNNVELQYHSHCNGDMCYVSNKPEEYKDCQHYYSENTNNFLKIFNYSQIEPLKVINNQPVYGFWEKGVFSV